MDRFESEMLAEKAAACTKDIKNVKEGARITLEEQVRAYDLLDFILSMPLEGDLNGIAGAAEALDQYCCTYELKKEILKKAYDEAALRQEAEASLKGLTSDLNELRYAAAAAASLHEFAKEVFEIWKTAGIFARRRALRELRERAGFRLESHRIGNYVAKTFDLMNEAQSKFAKAQQTLFSADVSYKIQPEIYKKLYATARQMLAKQDA